MTTRREWRRRYSPTSLVSLSRSASRLHNSSGHNPPCQMARSFSVVLKFSSKRRFDATSDVDQLLRHAEAFGHETQKILLLLTKRLDPQVSDAVSTRLRGSHPDIVFRNVTYEQICASTKFLFKEHESEMQDLIEDLHRILQRCGAIDQSRFLMRVVPCNTSIGVNRPVQSLFSPIRSGLHRT